MCAAITRWVQYDPTAVGVADDGKGAGGVGTRGYSIGAASVGDTFTIGPTTNKLGLTIDGVTDTITLYSGTSLDPRFIARDITEKMRNLVPANLSWSQAECRWEAAYGAADTSYGNRFKLYSGSLGATSAITVVTGTSNSAHTVLGWGTEVLAGGMSRATSPYFTNFDGDITISGTYYGFMDETYKIVITNDNSTFARGIGTATKDAANTYDGTLTTGGAFNATADIEYTIDIDCTNGTTMGAGHDNVPLMSWTSSPTGDDSVTDVELLYPNHWYNIGTYGLMIKFTDAVFNTSVGAWTIQCYKPDYAQGTNPTAAVGSAEYVYSSNRGDMSSDTITTVSGGYTALGTRGLMIKFNQADGADVLEAGNEFYVICSGPIPSGYNISSLNYGNVTVSTESDVKCVQFEVESGAVELSTVKFGLQSHGTFSHHVTGNNDTYFRFGTVGPANPAVSGTNTGLEWWPTIAATDIDSDTPPSYLYATKANLLQVSTADDSQAVGSVGLASDPIYVNIRLGSAETGANSTINNRLYFDYS